MTLDSKLRKFSNILYQTAESGQCIEEVLESLNTIQSLWKQDSRFRSLVISKRISKEEKDSILRTVFKELCHPLVVEFVILLMERGMMSYYSILKDLYEFEYDKKHRIIRVDATVSQPLEEVEKHKLKSELESKLNMNTNLNVSVDPNLLGGIKLRIGNAFYDASIQRKIERLKENLLQS
jgi:F-type H+-transporting ATPase subunit delta